MPHRLLLGRGRGRLFTAAAAAVVALLNQGCALIAGLEERHGPDGVVELAGGQDLPRSIVLDGDNVYWATESKLEGGRAIRRVPKSGGATVDIALTGAWTPLAIAVDVTDVYWADVPDDCPDDATGDRLMRVPKASPGADPEKLWQKCHRNPRMGIAQDSARLYWTQWNNSVVSVIDKGTAMVTELASDQHQPVGIAVDSETVYWTSYDKDGEGSDDVRLRLKDGDNWTLFVHTPGNPTFIALDETHVYWVTESGSILGLAKDMANGAEPMVLASGLDTPGGIALDATHAYVTDSGAGTVLRVRKDGSAEPAELATSQSYPTGIAVDETHVYWTNFSQGQVMRLAKP